MRGEKPAVEHIRKNGDPIDVDPRFRVSLGVKALMYGQLAAGAMPGFATADFSEDTFFSYFRSAAKMAPELVTTYPVYGIAGIIASGAVIYPIQRHNMKNRVAESNKAQDEIRELSGEPVDIIRHKRKVGRRTKNELELRWYGADGAWGGDQLSDRQLSKKMEKMADFADEQGIEMISMGADWRYRQDLDIGTLQSYGTLKDGYEYMTRQKRRPESAFRIQIDDTMTDTQILQSTPDNIRELAEAIRQASQKQELQETLSLLDDLVDKLRDIHLTRLYRVYKDHQSEQSLQQFVDRARQILEESVGSEAFHMQHTDERGHTTRRRASGFAVVRGGNISQHIAWKGSDGTEGNGIGDDQSILRWAGAANLEALLSSVNGKKLINQKLRDKATAAVYLLGLDVTNDRRIDISRMLRQNIPDGQEYENPTTFQAYDKAGMVEFPQLRPRNPNRRIHYEHRGTPRMRVLGGGALIAVGLLSGISAGISAGTLYDRIDDTAGDSVRSSIDQATLHLSTEKYRERWNQAYQDQLGLLAPYMNGLATAEDLNRTLHNKIAAAYMDTFGWDVNSWVPNGKPYDWIANHIKRQPLNGTFVETAAGSSIGDVPSNDNATLFSITSPKGLPTNGYWYTGVYDRMHTVAGDPPLNTSLGYQRSVDQTVKLNRRWSEEQIAEIDYDYIVSTPYLIDDSTSNKMSLPIPQGGTIVGATIIDKDNQSNRVPLKITTSTGSGTYESDVDDETQNKLKEQNINNPSLQYYVKMTNESTVHNSGGLFVENMPFENFLEIAEQVKAELGLPKDASNEEVFNAIKNRKYSVTPFADERVPDNAVPYTDNGDTESTILEISKVLADLDSLNCNLASTLQLLATGAGGTQMSYEQATGFGENGDGFLTQKELHAWLIDSNNNVVDPTPTEPSDIEQARRSDKQESPIRDNAQWGGILLGAATLIVAYRRRDTAIRQIEKYRQKTYDKNVAHPDTPESLAHITTAIYGPSDRAVTLSPVMGSTKNEQVMAQLQSDMKASKIISIRESQGASLSRERKKSIRKVVRSIRQLNRYGNR